MSVSLALTHSAELSTSGAGGQVHWDNVTNKPDLGGSGDMSKAVYDADNDGVVDEAESAPWTGITDKPITFPPDVHTHDDRYFTESELSASGAGGAVHWDNITNKPATFGGDMTKAVYDLDNDGVVDRAASVPWAGITGTPATFLPSAHTHTWSDLPDAPSDTKLYARKDGGWVEVTAGSTDADTLQGHPASDFVQHSDAREKLTADRTYYVRADGNDSNNGLTDTVEGSFATIQRAVDVVSSTLDLGGKTVTIQVGNGTYTNLTAIRSPFIGGNVVIQGDIVTPTNVVISTTGYNCFQVSAGLLGAVTIQGFKFTTTVGGSGVYHLGTGTVNVGNNNYGSCATYHIANATPGGIISITSDYTISGGSTYHMIGNVGGVINCSSRTITLTGTPNFTGAFVACTRNGLMQHTNCTFSGGASGKRYDANLNGVIYTSGGGASYFPGSVAGTTATGGQYS